MPAQRLQPDKATHRGRGEAVENPEVSVCVGPEHLGTTATGLTIHARKPGPAGGGRGAHTFFSLLKTSL